MAFTKEYLEDLLSKHSMSEMASILNMTSATVRKLLSRYDIPLPLVGRADISDDDVMKDYDDGLNISEIAAKYHCSHETIKKRLNKHSIMYDRNEGIRRHYNRIHDTLWDDIRKDLDSGISITAVSEKHHIRPENVTRLMDRYEYQRPVVESHMELSDWYDCRSKFESKKDKHSKTVILYLDGIKSYYDTYKVLPTIRDLAAHINRGYNHVCSFVNENGLQQFVSSIPVSSPVIKVVTDLQKLGIKYELNNRRILHDDNGSCAEIDVYLPDYKLGIEINPTGTHSVDAYMGVSSVNYHQRKSLLAESVGVGLIHLYDVDIYTDRIYDIFYNKLYYLKHDCVRVGARKCFVKHIDFSVSNEFLEKYHFQGIEKTSSYRYGLYYGDTLVSVLTIGKSRYTKDSLEIIRYCVRPDFAVTGGFNKLFYAFLDELDCDTDIVSYMDLNKRFSSSNIYERSGFEFVAITKPDYFWAKKYGLPILKRYDTTKTKLAAQGFDVSKTEVEIMKERGYFRIFGAGSKRYVYHHKGV